MQIEEVDEDFEKELAAMMTDFKLPPSGPFPQARPDSPAGSSSQQDPGSTVSFRVMMRRGGRDDRSKAVQVSVMHVVFERLLKQATTTALAPHMAKEQGSLQMPWCAQGIDIIALRPMLLNCSILFASPC